MGGSKWGCAVGVNEHDMECGSVIFSVKGGSVRPWTCLFTVCVSLHSLHSLCHSLVRHCLYATHTPHTWVCLKNGEGCGILAGAYVVFTGG